MREFPEGFVWGAATSSYQIEGGWNADGKGPSVWDAFTLIPGMVADASTGQVACDHYGRMEEDVALMKEIGLNAYRFSICWPRLQPRGTGEVNEAGVQFYSRLIDLLLDNGIEPWPTLFHWEMPLALEMAYGGWLHPDAPEWFVGHARLCFERFGDRVKHWTTLNEPHAFAICGYQWGAHAPGRQADREREPYVVGYHMLQGHARAAELYRDEFQPTQNGSIGMAPLSHWAEPRTDSPADREAARRSIEFSLGWYAHPLVYGDYPESMTRLMGDTLPPLTPDDRARLKGSADFLGLNHYHTVHAYAPGEEDHGGYPVKEAGIVENNDIGEPRSVIGWTFVPWGMHKILLYLRDAYTGIPIYITENGYAEAYKEDPAEGADDQRRVRHYREYLGACHDAVADGADLRGFFAWSLMDNFEWHYGYSVAFGIIHVDFPTGRRTLKASARLLSRIIAANGLPESA
jgi:beta-galactosidase